MRAFLFIQTLAKGSLVSESFPVGSNLLNDVKFMFSKKATKIDKNSNVDLTLTVKISSNFVAFIENTNFTGQKSLQYLVHILGEKMAS